MPALVQYPCSRRAPSVMDADAVARFHAVAELEVTGPVKQAAALLSSCMAEGMAYSSPVTCTKGHPAMLCSVCSVMRSRVVSIATPR